MSKILNVLVFILAIVGLFFGIFIVPIRVAWEVSNWWLQDSLGTDWADTPEWAKNLSKAGK